MKTILILCCVLAVPVISVQKLVANPVQQSYRMEAEGKYGQAMDLMKALADREPRNYLAHLRTGWLAYLASNLGLSLAYYQKAVVLAGDAVEPRLGLMLPQLAMGLYPQVEATGMAVLRLDPKNYLARSRMAWARYLHGRYEEAADLYRGIIRDYPSDGEMHIGLAWALIKQGKLAEARSIVLMADTILPGNARVAALKTACGG